jgi:hypothetical protein
MANYAVDDTTFGPGTLSEVAALIETHLETIDDTKTIRLLEVKHLYGDKFEGISIIDT